MAPLITRSRNASASGEMASKHLFTAASAHSKAALLTTRRSSTICLKGPSITSLSELGSNSKHLWRREREVGSRGPTAPMCA